MLIWTSAEIDYFLWPSDKRKLQSHEIISPHIIESESYIHEACTINLLKMPLEISWLNSLIRVSG